MDRQDELPCVFQIPLQYNDGRSVEPEKMIGFFDALNRQFNGYTPLGKIEGGSWYGQVESSVRVEVWVTKDRLPVLEEIVKSIGAALGQKEMFLIVPEAHVRRYDLENPGTKENAANS